MSAFDLRRAIAHIAMATFRVCLSTLTNRSFFHFTEFSVRSVKKELPIASLARDEASKILVPSMQPQDKIFLEQG
jgi:hypothetical protein